MPHSFRFVLIVSVAVVAGVVLDPRRVRAQEGGETTRPTGTVSNLFATLDPDRSIDGLRVVLSDNWTLEGAWLLRYGTDPVPVRTQETETGHLLTMNAPVRGPHDLVVRVRTPDLPGRYEWTVQSLVREPSDTLGRPRFRAVERRTRQVTIESPSPPDRANRALSLAQATEPLRVRAASLPTLGRTSSFTIEFWVQTNGLDEVVLSTWNGNESVSYPAEFVVDQGGRMRFYSGQPGRHRALQTGRPVADGQWHHVAVVYDGRRSRLRLLLDGQPVDSSQGTVPPAPGPVPLAIGGRLNRDQRRTEDRQPVLSGRIDELRVWGEARSIEAVRRTKNRPVRPTDEADGRGPVRLGFDAEGPDRENDALTGPWPEGAQRVPTTLSFRSSLRNLRAETEGRTVTLQWVADAADIDRFVVERAIGKRSFSSVAELAPSEAEESTVSDVPAFTYTDESVPGHVVFYRIRLKRSDNTEHTSGTIKIGLGAEAEDQRPVTLIGNFPNPFSETTTVAYEVNEPTSVTITVWDLQGHEIAQLADGRQDSGYHEVAFDAADLPSGNYFLRLKTPDGKQSHKMVVLK